MRVAEIESATADCEHSANALSDPTWVLTRVHSQPVAFGRIIGAWTLALAELPNVDVEQRQSQLA